MDDLTPSTPTQPPPASLQKTAVVLEADSKSANVPFFNEEAIGGPRDMEWRSVLCKYVHQFLEASTQHAPTLTQVPSNKTAHYFTLYASNGTPLDKVKLPPQQSGKPRAETLTAKGHLAVTSTNRPKIGSNIAPIVYDALLLSAKLIATTKKVRTACRHRLPPPAAATDVVCRQLPMPTVEQPCLGPLLPAPPAAYRKIGLGLAEGH